MVDGAMWLGRWSWNVMSRMDIVKNVDVYVWVCTLFDVTYT